MQLFDIPPSRPVGDLKNVIKEAILDGIIPNEQRAARALLLERGTAMGLQAVMDPNELPERPSEEEKPEPTQPRKRPRRPRKPA